MTNGNLSIFEFDDIRVEPSSFRIWKAGVELALEPKTFQVLLFLLHNRGRLVEKKEILNAVWKDTFVTENAMTREISKLRKELGDDSKTPKYIQTAHTRGYRFIAETIETKGAEAETSTDPVSVKEAFTPTSKSISQSHSSTQMVTGFAAIGLLGLIIGSYFLYAGRGALGETVKTSIAVLPLKPIDQANRDEIYEIGIAELLIQRLGSMEGFVVRPLSATRRYAGPDQDALAAGREQRVDYVLASTYQLANGKIRFAAQLLNVASGQTEETYTVDREATNVFAMQDTIAIELGNKLLSRFGATADNRTMKRGTPNEEAYRLYLHGLYLVDKIEPGEARKAVEIFDQAVALDPQYALAWAAKAKAHRKIASLGRAVDIDDQHQKSMSAIGRALALDENLADAHSALCENKMYYEWDFAGAENECRRAIQIEPNSALAHQIYSHYLITQGRFDQGISEIKTAIDLEPTSILNQRIFGVNLYFARRYDEAELQLKRVMSMDPNPGITYPYLWQSLEMQGKYPEAFDWFVRSPAFQQRGDPAVQAIKDAYQAEGWQGLLRAQVRQFDGGNTVYFHGAGFNAKVGNKDQAFEYLNKSFERREKWMSMLKVDPSLDSLRDDPRFDALLNRVEMR